eukprot:3756356-Rhodomonas_salina.1
MEQIVRFYKCKGFPPVAKAGRMYKHTKQMKEKMANNKRLKAQTTLKGTPEQELAKALLETEFQAIEDERGALL